MEVCEKTRANGKLVSYLELFGPQGKSGLVQVIHSETQEKGYVYFSNGKIIHACTDKFDGQAAIFIMLTWDQSDVSWDPSGRSYLISCNESPDLLLFEFCQLEDNFPDREKLRHYIADQYKLVKKATRRRTMILPEFKQYALYLQAEDTELRGVTFDLKEGEQLVGSSVDIADVVIPHPSISRRHCCIVVSDNTIEVRDLASTNGTFIRDAIIEQEYIMPGEVICLGNVTLRLNATLKRKLSRDTVEEEAPLNVSAMPHSQAVPKRAFRLRAEDEATKALHWNDSRILNTTKKKKGFTGINAFNWRLKKKK